MTTVCVPPPILHICITLRISFQQITVMTYLHRRPNTLDFEMPHLYGSNRGFDL